MSVEVIRRLLAFLHGMWGLVVLSALSRVINQTLGVVIPAVAVSLVVAASSQSSGLGAAITLLAALALIKGLFRYLEQFTGHGVAFRLLARLRVKVFRWLQNIEPGRFTAERSGDLVARISGDIDRVEPFYAHTIAPLVAAIAVPVLTLVGLALLISPLIATALAPVVLVYLAIVPWIGWRRAPHAGAESRRLAGNSAAAIADLVQGATEIAVLGAADRVLAAVARDDRESSALGRALARDSALRSLAGGVLAGAALLVVAVAGIFVDLAFGELAVSLTVAWAIMAPLRALEEIMPDTEQSLAAARRLFELEDIETQAAGNAAAIPGAIRFESVTVAAGSQTVLNSVDLIVDEGAMFGVVGPSGSGKSTLVSTLVRHRDPTLGRVTIGGTPISELSDPELRRLVTIVPQRPDVFYGTVGSNLAIARPEATQDELRTVLAHVRLLNWVDGLDRGLDTPIGERGVGMSGGQMQRLAIARSLLRHPKILILDEATSELDPDLENIILDEIYSDRGQCTLIVVAHRMETVVSADLIAVMDRGNLVELGGHESLRAAGGLYARLWERHEDILTGDEVP